MLRYVWNTLSLSVSAQLGTLPFILYYFGSFPTYFLLANLVVVILAGGILMLTLVALCVASVPMVGSTVMTLLEWCTSVLNESTRWVQQLDGSQITSVYLSSSQACLLTAVIICFYLCWASGIHRKASDWIRLLMVCNLFVVVSCVEYTGKAPEQLYFFARKYTPVKEIVFLLIALKRDCYVSEMCILQYWMMLAGEHVSLHYVYLWNMHISVGDLRGVFHSWTNCLLFGRLFWTVH